MPELPVKEVRPSELHLPEIKREDIVRALSDIKMPEVDLTKIERPRIERASRSRTSSAVSRTLIAPCANRQSRTTSNAYTLVNNSVRKR